MLYFEFFDKWVIYKAIIFGWVGIEDRPFLEQKIEKSLKQDIDSLTIVPYFLYPGKKVKNAVTDVMKFQKDTKIKFLVTKPMSMHKTLINLVLKQYFLNQVELY